jgi:hypothetical protein
MVMNTNLLKYAFWGTKRGKAMFFHSPGLESEVINETMDDIRGAVTITEPDCNYYSLEFTAKYKVYSQYYPVNDELGRPGFLAVTIYIPHSVEVDSESPDAPAGDVLHLLNSMMNLYRQNYVNSNSRMIVSKKEDPSLFDEVIAKARTLACDDYCEKASPKNDSFKIIRYSNDDVLRRYFDLPYQDEYFNHQEIVFITAGLNQKFKEELILNFPPPQPPLYSIAIANAAGCSEILFSVNGEEKLSAENLRLSDKISVRARKPYCKEFVYPAGKNDITIAGIISENGLSKKNHLIRLNLAFVPVRKIIDFDVRDENGNPLKATIKYEGAKGERHEVAKGTAEILGTMLALEGEQMQKSHRILVEAEGYEPYEYVTPLYPEDRASEAESVPVRLKRKPQLATPATPATPATSGAETSGTLSLPEITIWAVDENENLWDVEIFTDNVLLGKSGYPVKRNKIKCDTPTIFTLKRKGYEDVEIQETIGTNDTFKFLRVEKGRWKEKLNPEASTASASLSPPPPTTTTTSDTPAVYPPPQPPEKKSSFADFLKRNIVWIVLVLVLSILALVLFFYKTGLFNKTGTDKRKEKQIVVLLLDGMDTVKINRTRGDSVTVKGSSKVRVSPNRDTVAFPTGDTVSSVTLKIHLSNKIYGLPEYKDATTVISAKDSILKIYLQKTDTVMKIDSLKALLDSTTISYKVFKILEKNKVDTNLDSVKLENFRIIDTIFTEFDKFNPERQKSRKTNANEIIAENIILYNNYKKEFDEFYKKINPLKNKLSFKDKLKSFGENNTNYLVNRLNDLKDKKDDITLEMIFTKK